MLVFLALILACQARTYHSFTTTDECRRLFPHMRPTQGIHADEVEMLATRKGYKFNCYATPHIINMDDRSERLRYRYILHRNGKTHFQDHRLICTHPWIAAQVGSDGQGNCFKYEEDGSGQPVCGCSIANVAPIPLGISEVFPITTLTVQSQWSCADIRADCC